MPSFRQTQPSTWSPQHQSAPPRASAGDQSEPRSVPSLFSRRRPPGQETRAPCDPEMVVLEEAGLRGGACDAPARYSGASFASQFGFSFCWETAAGFAGTAHMSSVLSYESLVHAVAGAVVRRGLRARATVGCGASLGPEQALAGGWGWQGDRVVTGA